MGIFRTPAVMTEAPRLPPSTRRLAGTKPLRVLVVDDYPDAAEILALLLRMDGHEVQTAADGVEAMNTAHQFRPDAVILDIGLPEMDGYEVASKLRACTSTNRTRLIAMTGYASPEFRARAQAAGFDQYLVKPVTLARLQEILADHSRLASPPC